MTSGSINLCLPVSIAYWLSQHKSASTHQVCVVLLRLAEEQGATPRVNASVETLGDLTILSNRTVYAVLAILEAEGHVRRVSAEQYIIPALEDFVTESGEAALSSLATDVAQQPIDLPLDTAIACHVMDRHCTEPRLVASRQESNPLAHGNSSRSCELTLNDRIALHVPSIEDHSELLAAAGGDISKLNNALDAIARAGGIAPDLPVEWVAGFVSQWCRSTQPGAFDGTGFFNVDPK